MTAVDVLDRLKIKRGKLYSDGRLRPVVCLKSQPTIITEHGSRRNRSHSNHQLVPRFREIATGTPVVSIPRWKIPRS